MAVGTGSLVDDPVTVGTSSLVDGPVTVGTGSLVDVQSQLELAHW